MLVLLPIDTLPAFSNCRALVLRAKLNDIESIKYINTVISKKIGESAVFSNSILLGANKKFHSAKY